MIRALGRRLPGPAGPHTRIRCFCHILNLCVKVCLVLSFRATVHDCLCDDIMQAIFQPFTRPKKKKKIKGGSSDDPTLAIDDEESDDDKSDDEPDADDSSASQTEVTDPTPEGEYQDDNEDEDEVDPDREASDDAEIADIVASMDSGDRLLDHERLFARKTLSKVRLFVNMLCANN